MNVIIQYMLAFSALILALVYLLKTFVWPKKAKGDSNCGSSNCGCH